jgi:hypothetical protein
MSYKRLVTSEMYALVKLFPEKLQRNLSSIILLAILGCLLINVCITPQYLELYMLLRNHVQALKFLPSLMSPELVQRNNVVAPLNIIQSMRGTWIFTGSFLLVFLLYFQAIRTLPEHISYRYIQISTLLMGLVYLIIPITTSQDIISYTAYARMIAIYHLNPLVLPPSAISTDYVYRFLYWVNQPSAYGPVWIGITGILQWMAFLFGFKHVFSMEILLRLFGLMMHLGSMQLIWLISGELLSRYEFPQAQLLRIRATLAFAWNPFLLLEACVNAHNDVTILFLLLLAFWFLSLHTDNGRQYYMLIALLLALATCIKITYLILVPGFLLFLLKRQTEIPLHLRHRIWDMIVVGVVYSGVIIALYVPFWSHGTILNVVHINPAASRDINSLYEFGVNIYSQLTGVSLQHTMDRGSNLEIFSHYISNALFVCGYIVLCLYSFLKPRYVNTPVALIGWMAFVWLYYGVVGDPWFWPWYLIVTLGFLTIMEIAQGIRKDIPFSLRGNLNIALFSRSLMIGMFGLYVLWNFYNALPYYHYRYLSSLLIWLAPVLIFGVAAYKLHRKKALAKEEVH